MPLDLTVVDPLKNGWTVRFVDRKEFSEIKAKTSFGREALRAARMKKGWENTKVFDGALAYMDGKVVFLKPANIKKWLAERNLRQVSL